MKTIKAIQIEAQRLCTARSVATDRGYHALATQLNSEINGLHWAMVHENHSICGFIDELSRLDKKIVKARNLKDYNTIDECRWRLKSLDWAREAE